VNRRSMIKHAALGASAALLASGEVAAQSRERKPRVVITQAAKQVWKYKFVSANQRDVDQAGREMWEAVCMYENELILFKQPA
jgi:hypothetical protein